MIMVVYYLSHKREVEPNVSSQIHIGIYSGIDVVDKTISKYKEIEGFKDYPDGFVVDEYNVIPQNDNESLKGQTVYFLQHEYEVNENGAIYDYITNIDIFKNYEDAKLVMEKLIEDESYPKSPNGLYAPHGFIIGKCVIDEDNWAEGFVPY